MTKMFLYRLSCRNKMACNSDPAAEISDSACALVLVPVATASAKAMMSAMQSLQKAGQCIGNGQCWGNGKPGSSTASSKGSKGGKGVGTWSDNDAWSMPDEISDLWDNSGINRPDQAGRGNTDRDINTPDTLVPTKVKGQMQPGGAMPSITLKGVSIKGESRVQFNEAVAAAQSEAQAALSQEQVPKAYKNAVRDYFDDLKK